MFSASIIPAIQERSALKRRWRRASSSRLPVAGTMIADLAGELADPPVVCRRLMQERQSGRALSISKRTEPARTIIPATMETCKASSVGATVGACR